MSVRQNQASHLQTFIMDRQFCTASCTVTEFYSNKTFFFKMNRYMTNHSCMEVLSLQVILLKVVLLQVILLQVILLKVVLLQVILLKVVLLQIVLQ